MRPRIRTIKPEFFGSPTLNTVGVGARYVAIGLVSAADDRGRLLMRVTELRGFIFPSGDISEKQFVKALDEVIGSTFAWRYEVEPWSYLWLPNFWKHQKINRPTESSLPPHPRDPYGGMPIHEALAQFKADSENPHGVLTESSVINHGGLTPSRAGAHSVPFPSVVVHLSERLGERIRANDPKARIDPLSHRWLDDMRKLLDDREGDLDEVEQIIDWCQQDPFWRSNILSPGKLRKQFSQLLLKAAKPANVVPISNATSERMQRQQRRAEAMEREAARLAAAREGDDTA